MSQQRCIPELAKQQLLSGLALDSPDFAQHLDAKDLLAAFRSEFDIPNSANGDVYFASHALGTMPRKVPHLLQEERQSWRETGAPGHSQLKNPSGKPWTTGHPSGGVDERYTSVMADLVGAKSTEVAWMGSLSSDLHSLLTTFYRPEKGGSYKIIYEANAFSSDRYILASQVCLAGFEPDDALIGLAPRSGEETLRLSDILQAIKENGETLALVFFGAVHWGTGQWLDMQQITAAGKAAGCIVGWDCAHAAGNVPIKLHDWDVDFAAWCTYKYLSSGPGSTAGIFVHEKHFDVPRQSGWWGHELGSRFVHTPIFKPRQGAAGFAISNPSVSGTVPVHASMQVYEQVRKSLRSPQNGVMEIVRAKSLLLTGYLEHLISANCARPDNIFHLHILTPAAVQDRGACLGITVSYVAGDEPKSKASGAVYSEVLKTFVSSLESQRVVVDKRAPNLIRLSPSALYNTFEECWKVGQAVGKALRAS